MKSSQTRSIAIAAPPEAVVELLADGNRLPEWAPGFAPEVQADGDHWLIGSGGGRFKIRIRSSVELGTVDFLAAADERAGAFGRVIPNGDGSEFLFTLQFPAGTDDETIEAQMRVVEEELEAVRALAEA
jgi:Polyketide cyclase / dehydrase and lipid transport